MFEKPYFYKAFSFSAVLTQFNQLVPAPAAAYCQQLWQYYGFNFQVVRPRRTRFGDFRRWPDGQTRITVNANLNPYAFLITYIHEVAHADVARAYKRRVPPHGTAWQRAFQRLMHPCLTDAIFPSDILQPLRLYMTRPAATTSAYPALVGALRQFDTVPMQPTLINTTCLSELPEGTLFAFAKKTWQRGTMRRTRIVCKELSSGKSYAILSHVLVERVVKNAA